MGEAKRKKQRECPALGRIITPEVCGKGRNSTIACPADCPHNPFALVNYEAYLDLEGKVASQLSAMLLKEASPTLAREMEDAFAEGDSFMLQALHSWHLYGEGRVAKWIEQNRFADWKNDEQVMLESIIRTRPALVEFQQWIDDYSWMAVDLFRPDEPAFVVIDRRSSARACRHDVVLGFVYELPAGKKLAGAAISLPSFGDLMPLQVMERLFKHLGAPESDREAWIYEHLPLLGEALFALGDARSEKLRVLADSLFAEAEYGFPPAARASLVEALSSHPSVFFLPGGDGHQESKLGALLADEDGTEAAGELTIAATFTLGPDSLHLFYHMKESLPAGNSFLESLGLPLELRRQANPGPPAPLSEAGYDHDLVPEELLRHVVITENRFRLRVVDDEPLPALPEYLAPAFANKPNVLLDGATPRIAAADPALRGRLVALMKGHVRACDWLRRSQGEDVDLNPLLDELGLTEIIFPAPPTGELDPDDEDDEGDDDLDRIPLTPPPRQPLLEGAELNRRVADASQNDDYWQDLQFRSALILKGVVDMEDGFNPDERRLLFGAIVLSLGVMHPHAPPDYDPDPMRMALWYQTRISTGDPDESVNEYLDRMGAETEQPEVAEMAYRVIMNGSKQRGQKIRSKRMEQLYTAACAAIWEAAHWPVKL